MMRRNRHRREDSTVPEYNRSFEVNNPCVAIGNLATGHNVPLASSTTFADCEAVFVTGELALPREANDVEEITVSEATLA